MNNGKKIIHMFKIFSLWDWGFIWLHVHYVSVSSSKVLETKLIFLDKTFDLSFFDDTSFIAFLRSFDLHFSVSLLLEEISKPFSLHIISFSFLLFGLGSLLLSSCCEPVLLVFASELFLLVLACR